MNGFARLDAIRELGLDSVADRSLFSHITVLASTMLGCPVSLLSVVEDERQWFLGATGFDLAETPIDVSFCAVCILGEGPLLVGDARTDARFAGNALVTGAPFIRSYLGVPIRSDEGVRLGALCAISPQPHAFAPDKIEPLAMLAGLAEQSIALHARTRQLSLANAALKQASQVFRQAERATNVGSWRVDIATRRLFLVGSGLCHYRARTGPFGQCRGRGRALPSRRPGDGECRACRHDRPGEALQLRNQHPPTRRTAPPHPGGGRNGSRSMAAPTALPGSSTTAPRNICAPWR